MTYEQHIQAIALWHDVEAMQETEALINNLNS